MDLYTIYKNPKDYPSKYVGRRFVFEKPTEDHVISDDIEYVRDWAKEKIWERGSSPVRFERDTTDFACIVETWL